MKQLAKFVFLLGAPLILALLAIGFLCGDLLVHWRRRFRPKTSPPPPRPMEPPRHASVVIPNWNGKDLLEKYLPSVVAACSPDDEIIVVDNASTDGSAEFVERSFPRVRVLRMDRNLGFGGAWHGRGQEP